MVADGSSLSVLQLIDLILASTACEYFWSALASIINQHLHVRLQEDQNINLQYFMKFKNICSSKKKKNKGASYFMKKVKIHPQEG
jgi:prolipoprotein diacylglyceryltransferase